jgi:SPASM domain peptide maturase of grasp-with-spasm system
MLTIDNHSQHFLCLYADCIPVKGAHRSAICDLTRNELVFFPSDYWEVLEYLRSDRLGMLLNELENEEEKVQVTAFIDFLHKEELIHFCEHPSDFPAIHEHWEIPSLIQNAIIDVDKMEHDFEHIFKQLDEVECQFVQIRCFSLLIDLKKINEVVQYAYNTSIESVELLLPYDATMPDTLYIQLLEQHPIISSLILHSAPEDRSIRVDYDCDAERSQYIEKTIAVTHQIIDSATHCGVILQSNLCAPSVSTFFENKLHNGCLNKKVAIDAWGEIKNCPSMNTSFGNIKTTKIIDAVHINVFKEVWKINKDQIETCKDCELRYACTDCRAFLEQPDNMFSKPLKCGYDPYTSTWEEWSTHPFKQHAQIYYGIGIAV